MIDNPTLRGRILSLLQRSRKAVRLYSSVSKVSANQVGEFAEQQAAQWRETNTFLVRSLTTLLEHDGKLTKDFSGILFKLADDLQSQYSLAEAELGAKQCALIFAAENGDFTRAALLSSELISIKAQLQARQAAHHELMEVIGASRLQRSNQSPSESGISETESSETESSQSKSSSNIKRLSSGFTSDKSSEIISTREINGGAQSKIIPLRRAFAK